MIHFVTGDEFSEEKHLEAECRLDNKQNVSNYKDYESLTDLHSPIIESCIIILISYNNP